MAPRLAPTSVLKDRAETAEQRVLELQGTITLFIEMYANLCGLTAAQLEQAQSDSAAANTSAAQALALVEEMRAQVHALNLSSSGSASNGGSGAFNHSTR